MGVVSAAGTFLRGLFGFGAAAATTARVGVTTGRTVITGGTAIARGAQATGRALLAGARAPITRRILPFAAAGAGGAIIGGTLLDDVNPDLAMQLRAMGFDPARLSPRPKTPELVFDPVSGATFRRVKKRRARGISAPELRGFNKVVDLLAVVGRVPRKLDRGSSSGGFKRKKR